MAEHETMLERIRGVETWIQGHEKICGERYDLLMKVISVGGVILLGVAGFGMKSIYDAQQDQNHLLQAAMTQIAANHH